MRLAALGEKATPAKSDITGNRQVVVRLAQGLVWVVSWAVHNALWRKLTGFGQVKVLLAEIAHKPKQRHPASEDGDDDVEIVYRESRHLGMCLGRLDGTKSTGYKV